MNDANAASAPALLRRTGSLLTPEMIAIVTVGMALGTLILTTTDRIENQLRASNARFDSAIAETVAERRAYQARAAAERRAFQARMDEFRGEIRRPGERQGHLEGRREGAADR